MLKLRDYQGYGVNAVMNYFTSGKKGNPVIAMPTGTGKSLIIAAFVKEVMTRWPNVRCMMLTHVKELIEQNYDKLLQFWPTAPAGIYSAGVGRKEHQFPITFGGIQSVYNAVDKFGKVDIILVDECHLIPNKSDTMYRKFLDAMKKKNPRLVVIGLTATPYRVGTGMVTDHGGLFDEICCDMTTLEAFNWFLDQGYLSWLVPRKTELELDTTGIRTTAGDFNQQDAQRAADKDYITEQAVAEIVAAAKAEHRSHWLIFATGVEHCEHIVSEIQRQGYTAVSVHSKMTAGQRDANIAAYKAGQVTALVNMGVLTTGFDSPHTDLLGILRLTKSPGLWVQIMGRGTRPVYAEGYDLSTAEGRLAAIAEGGKPNCLVMDFARNTPRLGCINDPVIPKAKKKGGGDAPVRECACGNFIHASLRVCPFCGMEYPPEIKFTSNAAPDELIARKRKADEEIIVQCFGVDKIFYLRSNGAKGAYIQVSYHCGLRTFNQPLCFDHPDAYPRHKSREWWRKATGEADNAPNSVEEAMGRLDELQTPRNIRVWMRKKYPEIKFVDYTGELDNEREPAILSLA